MWNWPLIAHVMCMSSAVLCLLPLGISVARWRSSFQAKFSKKFTRHDSDGQPSEPAWLFAHSTLLFASNTLMLLGVTIMFLCRDWSEQFRSVQEWLGLLIVAILVFKQPSNVEMTGNSYKGGEASMVHRYLGYFGLAIAVTNALLGVRMLLIGDAALWNDK